MRVRDTKAGHTVRRMLGTVPMDLVVVRVTEDLIYATRPDWAGLDPDERPGNFWTFDRETGAEIDDDLAWGPKYGVTGSYLSGIVEEIEI